MQHALPADRKLFRELYFRETARAVRYRYALLVLDALTLVFIIATSFIERTTAVEVADTVLGLVLLAEFYARLRANPRPWHELVHPASLADAVAIICFLIPALGAAAGFLRALRVLRLLRSPRLLNRLARDFPGFRSNQDTVVAGTDLLVFIFIMTGLVYETQYRFNPQIADYADALYFTITALTTTGFGDITLPGRTGRLLSVIIMFCGVTLFLRLAQALFRPAKVRYPCPTCGLQRHEPDAVHCKACGQILNIPDEDS
ncbi:two pore domain potassium channel family protein [Roseomonas sp. SSH11]|uniref:Two pore domain potassium channel family protein n=1 Tax=Pararoseomonas baculiformis TaxID=2820812 RepID=A0ABS4AAP4_9PROT|nr:potassium channel family protein [Pararoseomonas baculiformis]MBP0444063.1 two pore domain potassium channel family protein [Pararoseomonas baculiformis]